MQKATLFTKTELKHFIHQIPIFNGDQMKIINRKTPASEVEIKTDKSGFTYKSVKASYVKALVMLVSGGNYSFEVRSREFVSITREVIVEGRLTIHLSNGRSVVREQFGQHYLNIKIETQDNTTTSYPSEIGNGYKAAASDAFKKCASEIGFCWDIYGQEHASQKKEEQPEVSHDEKKKLERLEHFLNESTNLEQIQHNYNQHLKTAKETPASEEILKKHMKRLGFSEAM